MLYLIPTPLGNLADFSFRALTVIEECDYLLCEDTRRSGVLLSHYKVKKPMRSYHLFNESKRSAQVIEDLRLGKTIGLLTDAGTPCISDPGYLLVKLCREEQIPVLSIPGPCAATVALSASGFPSDRFQFIGFLPKKKGKLNKLIEEILPFPGTTVCYESPYRMKATLQALVQHCPTRPLFIARELTKKFEQHYLGTALELLPLWEKSPPKGEFVLIISPPDDREEWDSEEKCNDDP